MILYQVKFWDRRYDIISHFGKKIISYLYLFPLRFYQCLELMSVIPVNSFILLSLKKFDTAAWSVLAKSST